MERLKGKSILVGKEPGNARLLVAVEGASKKATIGQPGSVPNCVSRCLPEQNIAHVQVKVDAKGRITVINMKPQNITYVDGLQVDERMVEKTSNLQLGAYKFNVNLKTILDTACKLLPAPVKEYSIRHLKKVYEEYMQSLEGISKKQQRTNKMRMIPIMVGTLSSALGGLLFLGSDSQIGGTVSACVGVMSFLVYAVLISKKDTSFNDRQEATKRLQNKYVCPNPECGKFLGAQYDYTMLKRQYSMQCPHCKCKWKE